jgi:hypothetical protein
VLCTALLLAVRARSAPSLLSIRRSRATYFTDLWVLQKYLVFAELHVATTFSKHFSRHSTCPYCKLTAAKDPDEFQTPAIAANLTGARSERDDKSTNETERESVEDDESRVPQLARTWRSDMLVIYPVPKSRQLI